MPRTDGSDIKEKGAKRGVRLILYASALQFMESHGKEENEAA